MKTNLNPKLAELLGYGLHVALSLTLLSGCDRTVPENASQPDANYISVSAPNVTLANSPVSETAALPLSSEIPGLPPSPELDCNQIFAPKAKSFYCLGPFKSKNSRYSGSLWRWNPFIGKLDEFELTENFILMNSNAERFEVIEIGDMFVLTTDRLKLFSSGNPTMLDEVRDWVDEATPFKDTYGMGMSRRKVAVLSDQSVITLIPDSDIVERISLNKDKLIYERMPKLPGTKRSGVALVTLGDGRVMALGGNESEFLGCSPCVADTYILDIKGKSWSEGPKMIEPRADASATLLPDGNVLVAGGWTPGHGSGGWGVLSRTVEHWDAGKNIFIKNAGKLPTGVARHQAIWTTGKHGTQLLVAGGNSAAVQAYDVKKDIWRQAGEFCEGNERGNLNVISGDINGLQLVIRSRGGTCYQSIYNTVAPLRLNDENYKQNTALQNNPNKETTIFRSGSAYLPGKGNQPSLVLGGSVHAGMNAYNHTAAVDAIWPDGRTLALPAFNHARSGAQVFRLLDGSILLVGGHIDEGNDSLAIEKQFPAELLPGNLPLEQARWIPLEGDWGQGQLVQLVDGNLFSLDLDGKVRIIRISGAVQGKPSMVISELPVLHRARRQDSDNGSLQNITGKELPDGRLIVAGGNVQEHRIALLQESSSENDSPDEYMGIGAFLPSDTYEIYEPATRTWLESARSQGKGGLFATLDDGRVVRFGKLSDETFMEISSPDGNSWSALAEEKPPVRLEYDSNLFVEQGELFLAGKMDMANTNGGVASLHWFNTTTRHWETIWQAEQATNWRYYVGLIISRTLSNGKVVTLPVAGL